MFRSGVNSFEAGLRSKVKSPPKLSRKPRNAVVSAGENRSAEDGNGGGFGNICVSKANSKSAKWTGGCKDIIVEDQRRVEIRIRLLKTRHSCVTVSGAEVAGFKGCGPCGGEVARC